MIRASTERVLLIGDSDRQMEGVLAAAMPLSQVTRVSTYFDAIAELAAGQYTAVLASAEPVERRPDAAMKALRQVAPTIRLVLFGHPTLEPLARKMMEFGCDDYLIAPASPGELRQIFSVPMLRIAPAPPAETPDEPPPHPALAALPLAEIILDALNDQPHNAIAAVVERINQAVAPARALSWAPAPCPAQPSAPPDGATMLVHPVRSDAGEPAGQLQWTLPKDEDPARAQRFLARLAALVQKMRLFQERHNRLQKLAITDEMTGLYNTRYFRHFLTRMLDLARAKRFPVTLFIFDIDNFKHYNDLYGHGVGDEILRQTATLIRRCCREHDLVARIGGDEFAVVFWEKEGPRQPREPRPTGSLSRTPQTPLVILDRFRKLLATHPMEALGPSGKGVLTISGGIAVYPYDARSVEELIAAADHQLMFKAKKAGKNKIFLVGRGEELTSDSQ